MRTDHEQSVVEAWLLALGFHRRESDFSCSSEEFVLGVVVAYQTGDAHWSLCLDADGWPPITAIAYASTFEEAVGLALLQHDAPHR